MGQVTGIEWTDMSSNPVRYRDSAGRDVWACVKHSPGCAHCYSEAMATRFGRGGPFTKDAMRGLTCYFAYAEGRKLLSRKRTPDGSKVFVGDMTDVFGEWVPDDVLDPLFAAFALRPGVTFQVLTKRADRMRAFLSAPDLGRRIYGVVSRWLDDGDGAMLGGQWFAAHELAGEATESGGGRVEWTHWRVPLTNVWCGVSVEDQRRADERIPELLKVPAAVRFLSCEPLLGPIEFSNVAKRSDAVSQLGKKALDGIDWMIVGGESGADARPCHVEWVRSLVGQCRTAGVACFVKQMGTVPVMGEAAWRAGPAQPLLAARNHGRAPAGTVPLLMTAKGGDPSEWPADLRVREFPGAMA